MTASDAMTHDEKGPKVSFPELVWTPEMIKRFWDWQSQYPEQYFTYQFGDTIVRNLGRWLRGRQRVADYGCGTGFLIPHLSSIARVVIGLDLSPRSVQAANDLHGHLQHFEGAFLIEDVLVKDIQFDAVTVIEVVEHLYDPELAVVLDNVRRLLAKGGVAIFTTPNDERLEASLIICPVTGQVFHRYQHVRKWTAATLSERLRASGFEIIEAYATNLGWAGWRRPGIVLNQVLRWLQGDCDQAPHLVCVAKADVKWIG